MFLRSRRLSRGAAAAVLAMDSLLLSGLPSGPGPRALLLFSGNRARRALARPPVRVSALTPHRQSLAVAQPPVTAEIHQPLDIHRDLPPQIAFDRVIAIDHFADTQHLVVRQLV